VRKVVAECTVCAKNKRKVKNRYKGELIVEDASFGDFLSVDLLGSMTLGQARIHIIVIVDRYSRFVWSELVNQVLKDGEIFNEIRKIASTYKGIWIKKILTDNGRQFFSNE
jgi:hypothetical protein